MNIREANLAFHRAGIFLNAIEYPAVPLHQERFRISLMCVHTKNDIDRLAETVDRVWRTFL
jgi:glycine C-acetyltransferase